MCHIRIEQPQFGICQMPPNKQETACGRHAGSTFEINSQKQTALPGRKPSFRLFCPPVGKTVPCIRPFPFQGRQEARRKAAAGNHGAIFIKYLKSSEVNNKKAAVFPPGTTPLLHETSVTGYFSFCKLKKIRNILHSKN